MIDLCKEILEELLNIDTRSCQNRETDAAMILKKRFDRCNIPNDITEFIRGKGNLVSFIPGSDESKSKLLLLAHLDTADFGELNKWRFPPDKATRFKNCTFGRGALDCKGLISVFTAVMIYLKLNKINLKRGVVFAATSDEENGGAFGCSKLCEDNPLIRDCEFVLGEGGGFPIKIGRKIFYTCQIGEKGLLRYVCNTAEADLLPEEPINLDKYLPNAKNKLLTYGISGIRLVEFFIKQGLSNYSGRCLDANNIFHNVVIKSSQASSRILDIQYLPGYTKEKIEKVVYQKFGIKINDANLIEHVPSAYSSTNSNFYKLIRTVTAESVPNAKVIPVITPSYSDNRFFRWKEKKVFGFFPISLENSISGIHGYNEYVTKQSLELALRIVLEIILRFCTI